MGDSLFVWANEFSRCAFSDEAFAEKDAWAVSSKPPVLYEQGFHCFTARQMLESFDDYMLPKCKIWEVEARGCVKEKEAVVAEQVRLVRLTPWESWMYGYLCALFIERLRKCWLSGIDSFELIEKYVEALKEEARCARGYVRFDVSKIMCSRKLLVKLFPSGFVLCSHPWLLHVIKACMEDSLRKVADQCAHAMEEWVGGGKKERAWQTRTFQNVLNGRHVFKDI